MDMKEVLSQLARYVTGDSSLRNLEEWIVSHLQSALETGSQEVIRAFDQIDALLMKLGAGQIGEKEFMDELNSMLNAAETLHLAYTDVAAAVTGSSDLSMEHSVDLTGQAAQIRLVHTFA